MSVPKEEKPQISGAICAAPQNQDTMEMSQPRQPTNLPGLMKFAMEATKNEDGLQQSNMGPMDEARRKFLEQALHSLTVDVIKAILQQVKILEHVDKIDEDAEDDQYVAALDKIAEYVIDIDTANDFHKIGGFVIIPSCLKAKSPKIKAQVCNLLAELCQNNPYCQRVVLENGILPMLIDIIEKDTEVNVLVKAMYAISCIVRQNSNGCTQLIQYKGIQIFLETLKKNLEKVNTKICFLLQALCCSIADFTSRLIFVGYIPVLISLISTEPRTCDEHVLNLLLKLIENNSSAIQDCRQNKLNAKEILENYLSVVKGKEEYMNEEELCNTIYNTLFAHK